MADKPSTKERQMFDQGYDKRRFKWTKETFHAMKRQKLLDIENGVVQPFTRSNTVPSEDFGLIQELYQDHGVSCREIGRKWECSPTVISRILKSVGINPRIGRPKVHDED